MSTGLPLYESTCKEISQVITERYSTSFSLGIKAFAPQYRPPIYAIYGFVRLADEIVDTFYNSDQELMLQEFRADTYKAIDRGVSTNPVLHNFQSVVRAYGIDKHLIDAFLDSMAMDLNTSTHHRASYDLYIYGSAEVVGLMCLKVWCKNDPELYEKLTPQGKALGAAFQKVNFLRDMKDDFDTRGRTYFPNVDFDDFTIDAKNAIEDEIEADFKMALSGIKQLPKGVRLGVYLAYKYFWKLFLKIKKANATTLKEQRIRVNDGRKLMLFATSTVRNQLNLL